MTGITKKESNVGLKKIFANAYKVCILYFILVFSKVVCPHKYINDRENFLEALLPEEKEFYSNLNKEHINDAHCKNVIRV